MAKFPVNVSFFTTKGQVVLLDETCEQEDLSRSELMRRAVNEYLDRRERAEAYDRRAQNRR